ncbi:MAG: hypothetical protein KDE26_30460, partial [Bacteroidetes bacterium]|nr:hypothetical protein [Bacteroidota bacterium]
MFINIDNNLIFRRMIGRMFLFWVIGGLMVNAVSGQKSYTFHEVNLPLEDWRWIDFPYLDGKGVRYMCEYQSDEIWFATNQGLIHFNGYEYQNHGEPQGLMGNPVHLVYVNSDGITFAATDVGIFRLSRKDYWEAVIKWPEPGDVSYYFINEISGQKLILGTNIGAIVLEEGEGPTVVTEKSLEKVVENLLPEARIVFFPDLSGYQASFGNVSD